ncbi:polysaccharide deacetylase family protein (plasmid) [Pseudarthrobacter sp. P1]|uniref:polysaccharide deacetylase family protein n=1 Tax=Pseudarthrobacter sp. P1 TaxID=3418418 RepID=UPI003CF3200B
MDANAGGRHQPSVPDAAAGPLTSGLSISHQLVLATGNLVGSSLVQTRLVNATIAQRTETITFDDLATGASYAGLDLVSPDRVGTLRTLIVDASAAATTPGFGSIARLHAAGRLPDADLLSALAFTPAGDLDVSLNEDPGTGAPLAHPVTVTLAPEATVRMLSPAGAAVRRAARANAPFNVPAAAPGALRHINCDIVPCAALTYDDGPNTQTSRLLGILAQHQVFATFFEQGAFINSFPQISRSVADAGHVIGNHTMSHPHLTKLPVAGVVGEIQGDTEAIQKAAGVTPAFFRPPYGDTNAIVARAVGLPQIMWSVDSLDWQSRNKEVFLPRILDLIRPGSIVLQHDIHASTVDGQDQLISSLQEKGYHLVTVPQLFAGITLQPGGTYKCRGTQPGCTPGR